MKFRTLFTEYIPAASEPGAELYTWQYVDEKGEIFEETIDVYARTQSYENTTRYKELIENGISLGADNGGVYADVSAYAGDVSSGGAYIASLISELQKAIAQEQGKEVRTDIIKSAKASEKSAEIAEKGGKINEVNG